MAQTPNAQISSGGLQLSIDTEVVFKIADVLFSLPRSQLMTSEFFRDMLSSDHIGSQTEGTKENPIALEGVTLSQVASFCQIASSRRFDPLPEMTFQEWFQAFQIATLWGFEQLRAYIIKIMDSIAQDPLDRIQLADQCGLSKSLYPAYAKLCARDASLTAEEGRRLGFERYAALCRIREDDLKATNGLRAAQHTFGLEESVTSGVSVTEGKHHKKNVKRKQKEKAKKALEKALKTGAGDGQAVGNVEEPSPPQVFGRPPELQSNCKNNYCKPSFGLSFKEQQFLAKVARAEELKVD